MKSWKILLLLAMVCLASCQSEQKQEQDADTLIEDVDTTIASLADSSAHMQAQVTDTSNPNGILVTCDAVGKITMADTYADVLRKAGKDQVKNDSVFVKGKFYNTFCTKVWSGTTGEITINWQESKPPYQTIQNIIIDRQTSTYVLENGLKLGSKLSLFNKLNGKPFSLYGFDGDNKGLLVSYNGGNLEAQIPCIRPVFGLKITVEEFKKAISSSKNGIESSEIYTSRKIDPVVVKLIVNSKR